MKLTKIRPTRFAHAEGHTSVCYTHNGRIITGGADGDIRIFNNLDDDDCISHTIADEVFCLGMKNNDIIVGTNLNMVHSYNLEEGKPNGVIIRCTSFPTHLDISKDGSRIAVASSDMTAKVHECINYKDLSFSGHTAPLLSVALDPNDDFLATSSCDGTVRVWNYRTQTIVRSFSLIPSSNDFAFSPTLCRLCWSSDGQYLFIPVKTEIHCYNRRTFKAEFLLSDYSITSIVSVVTLSPCGKFIAAGCVDGRIVIWEWLHKKCIISEKPFKSSSVTDLAWNPLGKQEIAFVNKAGEFGTMENFFNFDDGIQNADTEQSLESVSEEKMDINKELYSEGVEGENEVSLSEIKAQLGFADDEDGTFVGIPEISADQTSSSQLSPHVATTIVSSQCPEPQKPFQPSMSPESLSDRYMLWNNTGIVRQYQTEEENNIEVEFHDSSVHHSLHINNHMGHTMAALNDEALVLSAEGHEEHPSHLAVHHFSSMGENKEWRVDMPEEEDILAICVGGGWLAVATNMRNLRIFSMSGIQRDVISLPGPVVSLSGYGKDIFVVFHSGIGVRNEQSMSCFVLNLDGKNHILPKTELLPLSPKSFLAWIGFTDEGTPIMMDSAGIVKILNRNMGPVWFPILNTKIHVKGKSDHYFVIGASEMEAVLRCVLCKGHRYPPLVPRPHLSLLQFKIPLCDNECEKSLLEEKFIRSKYLMSTLDHLNRRGFDVQKSKDEVYSTLKEVMVKLFALACRSDRDTRAVEVCKLMPDAEMVEVAIRFASKLHRMQIAERLTSVVQEKVKEFSQIQLETEKKEISMRGNVECENLNENIRSLSSSVEMSENYHQLSSSSEHASNPLLAASLNSISDNYSPRSDITPNLRNPFKKDSNLNSETKGLVGFSENKVFSEEGPDLSFSRPLFKKPTRRNMSDVKENQACNMQTNDNSLHSRSGQVIQKTSALKLWLEDNREMMKEKFSDANETELLVKSAHFFKTIDDAIKKKYKDKSAHLSSLAEKNEFKKTDDSKRKSNTNSDLASNKKSKTEEKLSKFAFSN